MNLQPYIYDIASCKRYYICQCCESKAMREEPDSSYFLCMACGSVEHAPRWEPIVEPRKAEMIPSEAWIGADDYYNILYFTNAQMN